MMQLIFLLQLAAVGSRQLLPPLRAPATPLWVHSPYVNWLMPADNATGEQNYFRFPSARTRNRGVHVVLDERMLFNLQATHALQS